MDTRWQLTLALLLALTPPVAAKPRDACRGAAPDPDPPCGSRALAFSPAAGALYQSGRAGAWRPVVARSEHRRSTRISS